MLLLLTAPLAFLMVPGMLITALRANAWIGILLSIIPALLLIVMYSYILKKSTRPFPLLLEEHFSSPLGRMLGFFYAFFFLVIASITLRIFMDFIETNVLPGTPISIFIAVILIIGFMAIKSGLQVIARVSEIMVIIGLVFSILVVSIGIFKNFNLGNLLPLGNITPASLAAGTIYAFFIVTKAFAVLTLAFFTDDKNKTAPVLIKVTLWYLFMLLLPTIAILLSFGADISNLFSFPTFSLVRSISIGQFIKNIDIIFIGVWIMGIFGTVTLLWFMFCYTMQQVFRLKEHRFLAAPSALLIGFGAIHIAPNITVVDMIYSQILPVLYSLFFVFIPLVMFGITLFKTNPETDRPEVENA